MNPVYLIKKTNICETTCCHCNKPACSEVVSATLHEFTALKLKEYYEGQCVKGCDTDDSCYSYCIERIFLTGQYEYLLINGENS